MKNLEYVGSVTKEEQMEILSDFALPKTFVLHIINPFPGFHGDTLPESATKPDNIFFITDKSYSWEKIIRATNKIKTNSPYKNLDASFATLMTGKNKFFSIRVHNIPTYNDIPVVMEYYAEQGFGFLKPYKKSGVLDMSIKLTKFFKTEQIHDDIFKDLKRNHMFYVRLDDEYNWNLFKKTTFAVKDNINNRNFDAALVTLFQNENVVDYIRIFKPGVDIDYLLKIKEKYADFVRSLQM